MTPVAISRFRRVPSRSRAQPGGAAGRPGKSALIAVAALAVTGVAGAAIVAYLAAYSRPRSPAPAAVAPASAAAAPAQVGPPQEALEKAALHSRLTVLHAGKGGAAGSVVAMGKVTGSNDPNDLGATPQGILVRELFRQALLIAARDELGLATRDEVIGDAAADGGGAGVGPIELITNFRPGACWVVVRRGEGAKAETLLKRDLDPGSNLSRYPHAVLPAAEGLSRVDFPEVLKRLGLKGRPNAVKPDAGLPVGVEEGLSGLGFVETFAAVRALHEAIRAEGESPARLSALARGYAQLGVLSEFHWHPAHKAFKARALLYAQRLVARDPGSPVGLWCRAYALALVGRQSRAVDDLNAAQALAEARGGDAPTAPGWLETIDAYAKSDRKRLMVKQGPDDKLAALLRMFVDEYPAHTALSLRAAKDVLALDPGCFRALDAMCQFRGVSNLHEATVIGPEVLTRLFPARLGALGGLPAGVRGPHDRRAGEVALVGALRQAGGPGEDAGEPSWAVLGHLVSETRFVQVWRRLHFMRVIWAVPVDEFWAEARGLVAGHRYLPYLESLGSPPPQSRQALAALADGLDPHGLEIKELEMIKAVETARNEASVVAWRFARGHCDPVALDFQQMVQWVADAEKPEKARVLMTVSRCSPYGMAALIGHDWEHAAARVEGWRKTTGDHPTLLGALGKRYTALGRVDEAQKLLTAYVKESADSWAYEMLAANYKARGDFARWQETLDGFLADVEDHGLDHAKVRVEIARHYMGLGLWAAARPYAEAAAETWAGWAMQCAADCAEGARDWGRAELWTRRITERYPETSWSNWLYFCKRTGHGDADAARAFTDRFLAAVGDRPDVATPETLGFYYWLSGDPKKALAAFRKVYEAKPNVPDGFALATIADDLGDAPLRDLTFKDLCEKHKDEAPKSIQICGMFREALSRGGDPPLDLAPVEKVIASIPPERRGNTEFFVGLFLKNHGKPDDARTFLRRCAGSSGTLGWMRAIASDTLRGLGAD